ncbi:DUF6216 family protein [Azotobacter salinestris]|uniref:DUF6216 family protein n=1 Tax=Azotobacter salinestris TaxID=69964 RepID=UPI00126692C9|nr:DUF6216 family protein [Azotobacter salinestris]
MNSEKILSEASSVISLVVSAIPLLSATIILLLVTYIWKRAGSTNFILERIWSTLAGGKEFNDQKLSTEWNKVIDFERFKFKTGIRFPNSAKIHETLDWLDRHGITLEQLIIARNYFDIQNLEIRDPNSKFKKPLINLIAVVIAIWIAASLTFAASDSALLKIKKTGTILWLSESSAQSWDLFSWNINGETCENNETKINPHDKQVICNVISNKNDLSYLKKLCQLRKSLDGRFSGSACFLFSPSTGA